MWLLYQILLTLLMAAAAPFLLLRRGRHYWPTLKGRFGLDSGQTREPGTDGEPSPEPPLWLHAVSVGEVGVAQTLASGLPPSCNLLVTTITPTGQERARAGFRRRAHVRYLPFDLGVCLKPFLKAHDPSGLVLIEGELWPVLLRHLHRNKKPIVMINGRISDRSFARLKRAQKVLGGTVLQMLYAAVQHFGMQSEQDRLRLLELGISPDRVSTTGNLKYETPEPKRNPELEAHLLYTAQGRPILIAGSTMPGEEELVLDALEHLDPERALLVLAPRHPERFPQVAELLARRGLPFEKRSDWSESPTPREPRESTSKNTQQRARVDTVLLDSLGELAGLYAISRGAFVGGTMVPTGGHNPIEPARFGTCVVCGPSMENFREIAQHFTEADAWNRAGTSAELAAVWKRWIEDDTFATELGNNARGLISQHSGALQKTLLLLREQGLLS